MNHLSAAMFEYDKHVEKGEAGRDHRKEVHGPRHVKMYPTASLSAEIALRMVRKRP
ncbi:hypothetical protein MYX75_05375 [Acidobacteria bacterium AH-259-A15]|nr:hypothetical protein [Acidobacteria bacterium AH-259-A15]